MSAINVYQQRPASAVAESPLHHAGLAELAGKTAAIDAGVRLSEVALLGHLTLRGDGADAAFLDAAQHALGFALPGKLALVQAGERSAMWRSPDEWLLIVPRGEEFALEQRLRDACAGQHMAVVNVSGGQTLLRLSGPRAREVLMKSTSYDVHPDNFPVGKAIATTFAKAACLIRRPSEDVWELVVRRSFADYFWLWLQDASAEFGLAIE